MILRYWALSVLGSRLDLSESRDVIIHVTNITSRDHSNHRRPFPIGGPLDPRLYLQRFLRYSTANVTQWLTWS